MPAKLWARPVLRVGDVAASISYYCDKLGFAEDWNEGGDDSPVAQVSRNGIALILDKHTYFPKAGTPSVVEDLDGNVLMFWGFMPAERQLTVVE
jgi:catechol 2,3-dioxygenase-like lactoylglutathione lyase family enzyme